MRSALRSRIGSWVRNLRPKIDHNPTNEPPTTTPESSSAPVAATGSDPSTDSGMASQIPGVLIAGRSRKSWICVDAFWVQGSTLLLYGWEWGDELKLVVEGMEGESLRFVRPDVNVALKLPEDSASGFLTRIVFPRLLDGDLNVQYVDRLSTGRPHQACLATRDGDAAMSGYLAWINGEGLVFPDEWTDAPDFLSVMVSALPPWSKTRAHLDRLFFLPGVGYLAEGWVLTGFAGTIRVVSSTGRWTDIENAIRTQRPDVHQTFKQTLADHAVDTGFDIFIEDPVSKEKSVSILMKDGEGHWYKLNEKSADEVPFYPVSFVETIFQTTTEMEVILGRLRRGEWKAVESAHRRWKASFDRTKPEVRIYGTPPERPNLSVIIPLYGTLDFVELQVVQFAKDPWFVAHAEVIYVVDDPTLNLATARVAQRVNELYHYSFLVVWGHFNRGFSGANNLGAAVARAEHYFFMNSDVFPTAPGWAQALLDSYQNHPEVGLLGCRLVTANGALQHDGMAFKWEATLGLHLNKHPGAGLPPRPAEAELALVPATTGAAILVSRNLFGLIEGFDEGYIVGDFEDSDLCLKARRAGFEIAVNRRVVLIHLERQSMTKLGQPGTRQAIVLYNAMRHEERWAPQLAALTEGTP